MVKEAVRALRRLGYIVHADVVVTFQGEKPERSFQNFGATLVFDNLIFSGVLGILKLLFGVLKFYF
jgi:hypothetical protein